MVEVRSRQATASASPSLLSLLSCKVSSLEEEYPPMK